MKNSRLTELLMSLNEKEMRELGYYVSSYHVNRDEKIKTVYKYISSLKKDLSELTKEELKDAAFDGRKVNDVYFRVVINGFVKIIEKFLSEKRFEEDHLRNKLYLLRELRERNCRKGFNQVKREVKEKMNEVKVKDADFYLKNAEFKSEDVLFSEQRKPDAKEIIKNLNETGKDVDYSYLIFKLDLFFNLKVMELTNEDVQIKSPEIGPVLISIENDIKEIKKDHALLYMKYLSVKMICEIKQGGDEYYKKLKKLIIRNAENFSPEIIRQLYDRLLAYCNVKRNYLKEKKFAEEELKLYKKLIEKEIINRDSKIGVNEFMNIIDCALSHGDSIWASNFVDEFSQKKFHGEKSIM